MEMEDLVKLITYIEEENRTEKTIKEIPHLKYTDFSVIKDFMDKHGSNWNLKHSLQQIRDMKKIEWKS